MKLDVKKYVDEVYEYLKGEVKALEEKNIKPKFAIYQIGNNPASNKYISNKIKKAESIGIEVSHIKLTKRYDDRYDVNDSGKYYDTYDIEQLEEDLSRYDMPKILQLPVSKDEEYLTDCIPSDIDLDGLSEYSKSKFYASNIKPDSTFDFFIPCTAKGVISYMAELAGDLTGKSVLIISRSDIVGRPLAKLALDADMMVTVAHSKISKEDILKMSENVDFIVSGIGIGHYFNQDEIPEGVTFIDVGIAYKDGKMVGDLEVYDPETVKFDYTPVPGGVGQLTVVSLLSGVIEWYM